MVMLERRVDGKWMWVVSGEVLEGGDGTIRVERIARRRRWGRDCGLRRRHKRVLAGPGTLVVVGSKLVGDAWRLLGIIHSNRCSRAGCFCDFSSSAAASMGLSSLSAALRSSSSATKRKPGTRGNVLVPSEHVTHRLCRRCARRWRGAWHHRACWQRAVCRMGMHACVRACPGLHGCPRKLCLKSNQIQVQSDLIYASAFVL